MSAVSSWYAFLVKLNALPANPAAVADRPKVDRDYSPTVSFTHEEAARMLKAAAARDRWIGPVALPLATWLVELGTRASETARVRVEDLGWDRGYRIVHMRGMKGGRDRIRVIPPPMIPLLEQYLLWRASCDDCEVEELRGPLFVTDEGFAMDRHDIYRFVRRLAREAGLPNADRITPHSFRHAWNGMARRRGAPLEDRQWAMGHKDPRTTRRYDRNDSALESDPSLLVAAAVATEEAG
jgi:integrase